MSATLLRIALPALLFLLLLCSWTSLGDETFSCNRNCSYLSKNIDLKWIRGAWDAVDFDDDLLYYISLCGEPVNNTVCSGGVVCANSSGDKHFVLGTEANCKVTFRERSKDIQFSFEYSGAEPYVDAKLNVTLVCGKNLGYPNVINSLPKDGGQGDALIEWVTSAACETGSRDAPVEENKCYALEWQYDPTKGFVKEIFDLSPLIKADGYAVDSLLYQNIEMKVNPCRAMDSCGSAACRKVSEDKYQPVANFSAGPRVEYLNNQLQLRYPLTDEMQANCTAAATGDVVRDTGFVIFFNCPRGNIDSVPLLSYVDTESHCLHTITWNTDYACGLKKISAEGCVLSAGSTLFNLTSDPLVSREQTVNGTDGATFTLGICSDSGLPEDSCVGKAQHVSVAQHSSGDRCFSAGGLEQTLRYADDVLVLTIAGGEQCSGNFPRHSEITFICPSGTENNSTGIVYTGEEHCLYSFVWASPAACVNTEATAASKCQFSSGEGEYDLGELLTDNGKNWVVTSLPESEKATYECLQVSPCGRLQTDSHTTAADYCAKQHAPVGCANSSVCLVGKDGRGHPFGLFEPGNDKHVVGSVGSVLTMRAATGLACNSHSMYSVIVDYVCRPGSLDSTPHYVGMEEGCEIKIEWQTAYACLDVVTSGDNCIVEDPKTRISFDLSPLRADTFHSHNTSDGQYSYEINFCGPALNTPCSSQSNKIIGMCQVFQNDSTHHFLAGTANSTVRYDGGVLQAVYLEGEKCKNGDVRQTTVNFECDPDALSPNIVEIDETSHCQYLVTVQSVHACPPDFRSMVCAHQVGGRTYDLSDLVKVGTTNWEVVTDRYSYSINLCRPLNLPRGGCTPSSSACRYRLNKDGSSTFDQILGSAASGAFSFNADRKQVVLGYNNGATCKINITFICDRSVEVTNGPAFESELNCVHRFTWRTPYACPTEGEAVEEVEVGLEESCVVQDPLTHDIYDFSLLRRNAGVNITDPLTKADYYVVNVCGPLPTSVCGVANTTVCQVSSGEQKKIAGKWGGNLTRHDDGAAILVYDNGEVCSQNKQPRRSEILFVCPDNKKTFNQALYTPLFVNESSHCVYSFHWQTRLACIPKRMSCTVGSKFNLRPLAEENIAVSTPWQQARAVISLCGPVNISSGDPTLRACPFGTAACLIFGNGSALSLGEVESPFNLVSNVSDALQLLYTGGTLCSGGKSSSVLITLLCAEEGSESTPVMTAPDLQTCSFYIRWSTRYACSVPTVHQGCSTRDPVSGALFNMAATLGDQKKPFTVDYDGYTYQINVCSDKVSIASCDKDDKLRVAGCQTKGTTSVVTGLLDNVQVRNQDWGDWMLTFPQGSACESETSATRTTNVHLVCDEDYANKEPKLELLTEDKCQYFFRLSMYNRSICHSVRPAQVCALAGYNLLPLSSLGNVAVAGIWDPDEELLFSFCQPLNLSSGNLSGCGPHSFACLRNKKDTSKSVSYDASEPLVRTGDGLRFSFSASHPAAMTVVVNVRCRITEEFGAAIITESNANSYTILMYSIYACPLNIRGLTSNTSSSVCSIRNPINDLFYNFTEILGTTQHQIAVSDGSVYHFDLCGGIPPKCGKENSGISVCKIPSGGTPIPIAGRSHYLSIAQDGAVEVVFNDSKTCGDGGGAYTSVRVTLVCSTRSTSPQLISGPDQCSVLIFWPTPLLCDKAEECTAEDQGKYFDLTPLSATPVWTGIEEGKSSKVWFGVCRSLNPFEAESHGCPASTAVCLERSVGQAISLGQLSAGPTVRNGHAVLQYDNGGACGNSTYSTTLNLHCSQEQREPLVSSSAACNYTIDLSSPEACELEGKKEEIRIGPSQCLFKLSNFSDMDFSWLLQGKDSSRSNSGFEVAVCHKVTHNDSEYIFNSSSSHAWRDAAVMVFDGKKLCKGISGSVHVHFECDPSDSSPDGGNPVYHGTTLSGCTDVIRWTTRFACSSYRSDCTFHKEGGSKIFDLSPLYHLTAYEVLAGGDTYYMNICGSIRPPKSLGGCADDSILCLNSTGDKTYSDLASASSQLISTTTDGSQIQLTYQLRSPNCTSLSGGQLIVLLTCDGFGQKQPSYRKNSHFDPCQYAFQMKTPYACEVNTTINQCSCQEKDCGQRDNEGGYSFNLAEILKKKFTFSYNEQSAVLRLCKNCVEKSGAGAICSGTEFSLIPASSLTSSVITVQDKLLEVTLKSSDGNTSVVVVLECQRYLGGLNMTKLELIHGPDDGKPVLYRLEGYTKDCQYVTTTTPGSGSSSPTAVEAGTTATDPGKVGISIVAILIVVALVVGIAFFLLLRDKTRRYMFKGAFLRIFTSKSDEPVKYTRLRKSEENAEDDEPLLLTEGNLPDDAEVDTQEEIVEEGRGGGKEGRGAGLSGQGGSSALKVEVELESGSDEELLDL